MTPFEHCDYRITVLVCRALVAALRDGVRFSFISTQCEVA